MVIAIAVVRDLTDGVAVGRIVSRLMLVVGVAPVLAPALGSQLLLLGSWRWLFGVLGGLAALLTLLVGFFLPESLPRVHRRPGGTASAARTYLRLLGTPALRGVVGVAGITMGGQFSYISASGFLFQEVYGLTAQQYGLVFGAGALTVTAGTQVSGALIGRVREERVALIALTIALTCSIGVVTVGALVPSGAIGLLLFVVVLAPALGAVGMMLPVVLAMALASQSGDAGSATALVGAAQFGIASVGTPMSALFGGSVGALGVAMALFFATALAIMVAVARQART